MKRSGITGESLFFLFVLGVFLFNLPLVSIFDVQKHLFGIPLLYIYLFASWGLLLLFAALTIERSGDATDLQDSRNDTAGKDRTA